jgi:hypothetical protein
MAIEAKTVALREMPTLSLLRLGILLLLGLSCVRQAHANATLLLEEPYSYDGALAGTGHVAVYLSNVCAETPIHLRSCQEGEPGIVLSRYDGISGYDWVAIPLIPYLYAVDEIEDVPLFSDPKLVAFLRDQYRRDHLEAVAPDRPDGATPPGNWYELIGSLYDRTIYAFEIETNAGQDARLIEKLNGEPNVQRYQFMKSNCADFVREVVNSYYPKALHRSIVGDLGVTTPKQIAKMMARYSKRHPELKSSHFIMPQVPGSVGRSKPIHGVLESVIAAKKYMIPLVVLHPYIGGGLLVEYFGHQRFDPARNALIMDANQQMGSLMTRAQRVAFESRLDEMTEAALTDPAKMGTKIERAKEIKIWSRMQAGAQLGLDASGQPLLRMNHAGEPVDIGLSRTNILVASESAELSTRLMEARLRQELRPANARKTAPQDVESDLALYRQLLAERADEVATFHAAGSRGQANSDLQ